MYAITGVTGHVGGAAARELLAAEAPARVVVRDPAKGEAWRESGAEVAVADFTDPTALTGAFAGADGVFVMLPTDPTMDDAGHRGMADSIATAVAESGVPHVVALSSVGADLPEGTGPIRWLHYLEGRLRQTGSVLTAIRPPHFQEKVELVLDAATQDGIYPVFGESADEPIPMVATRDVGAVVARFLLSQPEAGQAIDLEAPAYTERDVARKLGAALGRPLQVVTIPRAGWHDALIEAGMPPVFAGELVDLYEADRRQLLRPRSDQRYRCTTTLDETLSEVVPAVRVP